MDVHIKRVDVRSMNLKIVVENISLKKSSHVRQEIAITTSHSLSNFMDKGTDTENFKKTLQYPSY